MAGWEAMQQGAPDPFFADQRGQGKHEAAIYAVLPIIHNGLSEKSDLTPEEALKWIKHILSESVK